MGPLLIISQNHGGAYILAELDGSVFDHPVTAFRVISYFARKKLDIPDLNALLDISTQCLRNMEATDSEDSEVEALRGNEMDDSDNEASQQDVDTNSGIDEPTYPPFSPRVL